MTDDVFSERARAVDKNVGVEEWQEITGGFPLICQQLQETSLRQAQR